MAAGANKTSKKPSASAANGAARSGATPMMKQYYDAKQACPDALLLFRMGDFYEMFHDDAKTAARVLNLALTSRDKGENPIPMAGFPHHQLESYLGKLIAAGHRVPPSANRSRTPSRPRGWSAARSRASSRPARSPTTPCSTRARATTWPPSSTGRSRRAGLGRAFDRPVRGRGDSCRSAGRPDWPGSGRPSACWPRRRTIRRCGLTSA